MQIIKINLHKPCLQEIKKIAQAFQQEKIIAYPTDTVYGLGCRADSEKAIKNLYKIKKRDFSKPLIILVNSLAMAKKYAQISPKQEEFLRSLWPGPITVILKSQPDNPLSFWPSFKQDIAIRLPKSLFIAKVITEAGLPLTSTSLNVSGQKFFSRPFNLGKQFGGQLPDLAIDAGYLSANPSQIIDAKDINNIKKLRA